MHLFSCLLCGHAANHLFFFILQTKRAREREKAELRRKKEQSENSKEKAEKAQGRESPAKKLKFNETDSLTSSFSFAAEGKQKTRLERSYSTELKLSNGLLFFLFPSLS
jgi:hypothetical protein